MRAMQLVEQRRPLVLAEIARPDPAAGQVQIRVEACGVCRTDLHIVDGDLAPHRLPLVPGHEIVGRVAALGAQVAGLAIGDRVGVPWLGETCGTCPYCAADTENLCDHPTFTGYDRDGGYAEFCVAHADNCVRLPDAADSAHLAPLLCAGLIGYRAYRRAGVVKRLGLIGFGAAAHILAQVARADGVEIYAATRPGDEAAQDFARALGAVWAGDSTQMPPVPLDAAIIFASAGETVPMALRWVKKGGTVVCAGIHMSDIPSFPYRDLWEEREIVSIANLTRADGRDFFSKVNTEAIRTEIHRYSLEAANAALDDLRAGRFTGAAVLIP